MSAKEEAIESNNQKLRVTESVQPARAHGTTFSDLMMTKHLARSSGACTHAYTHTHGMLYMHTVDCTPMYAKDSDAIALFQRHRVQPSARDTAGDAAS